MKAFLRLLLFVVLSLCLPAMAQQDVVPESGLPTVMEPPPPAVRTDEDEASPPRSEAEAPDLPDDAPAPSARTSGPQEINDGDPAPLPAAEAACRERLRSLGVTFEEAPPISEPEGCSAAHPLTVSGLPGSVALEPPALLTCAMAEATARFVRDHAAPAVRHEFGAGLSSISQVSSYVCRPRNGSEKLSEHAFANALDWGTLVLDDDNTIDVRAHGRTEPRRTRLIERLRQAACGPFKTVLGPGSDADHADHFHFDLAERRNGGTFCQ